MLSGRVNVSEIDFVYPNKTLTFPVAKECALSCPHCNRHYIENMSFKETGDTRSCLLSGGCDADGKVPLLEYLDEIKRLKERYRVAAHTGLMFEEDIKVLSPFIDAVSFNFIGDDETIKEVYGLDKTVSDFLDSYKAIAKHVTVFPHITIGLHKGEIRGEHNALELLRPLKPEAVVFNIFVPTKETEYEMFSPPPLSEVEKIFKEAEGIGMRSYLGCMRPRGDYRAKVDELALDYGFRRIVMPHQSAVKSAEKKGYGINRREECCIL